MILLILVILLHLLLYLNFKWSHHDVFHPAVIFNFVFCIFSASCLILSDDYLIQLHIDTLLIIVLGVFIFSIITLLYHVINKKSVSQQKRLIVLKEIKVSKKMLIILIVMQIGAIYFFNQYLQNLSFAYKGYVGSITENISLYDTMTKFWTDTFHTLNVPIPIYYRLFNPVTDASFWIVLYISVHNFVVNQKINMLMISSSILQCILIILNGSRSPLFRVLTFIIVVFYILWRKKNTTKITYKFYFYLIGVMTISIIGFVGMIFMMRNIKIDDLQSYFFTYVGAQIENLNSVIKNGFDNMQASLFGEQTFRQLYLYVGKILTIPEFNYPSIDVFTFSQTGVELGNVYTTFYAFVYDFGIMGIIVFTGVMGIYYVFSYEKIKQSTNETFDYRLMIYAILFNDLVMGAFSNRFYSTVFDAPFMKMLMLSYIIYLICIKSNKFFSIKKR